MLRIMRSFTIIAIIGLLIAVVPAHVQGQTTQVFVRTLRGSEVPFELSSAVLQAKGMAEVCATTYSVNLSEIYSVVIWPPNIPNPTSLGSIAWYCGSSYGPLEVTKSGAQIACDYGTDVIKEVYGGYWWNRKFLGWACVRAAGG
jgi:hypothetical protein